MEREEQCAKKGGIFNANRRVKKTPTKPKLHSVIKLSKCRPDRPQSNFKFLELKNVYDESADVQQTQQLFSSEW